MLVTGATGLVGRVVVRQLVERGYWVRGLWRRRDPRSVFSEEVYRAVEWVQGDVRDVDVVERAMRGVEWVFHCAAKVSLLGHHRDLMLDVNVRGTRLVVEMAMRSGVERFVHVSSVAALGRSESGIPIDEGWEWQPGMPTYPYAYSKWLSEREVWRAHAEGLPAVVVNPSVILGEGDWRTDSSQVVGLVARGLVAVPPGGTGFVDVEDVASVMIRLAERGITGERFIVSAENWLWRDLFRYIAERLSVRSPWVVMPCWLMDLVWLGDWVLGLVPGYRSRLPRTLVRQACKRVYYDNWKVRSRLGYQFRPIRQVLDRLCEAYLREHQRG